MLIKRAWCNEKSPRLAVCGDLSGFSMVTYQQLRRSIPLSFIEHLLFVKHWARH